MFNYKRFICSQQLSNQSTVGETQCEDFEVRFCCEQSSTSTNQTAQSYWDQLELPKTITDLRNDADGFNISNPSTIGLQCVSGIIDDCNESSTMEELPFSCAGILMFSTNPKRKCGSQCDRENTNTMSSGKIKPIRTGWTKWIR